MPKAILKDLKPSELVVDEYNARGDDWDNDAEFVSSIKSQGVLEPLLVRPTKGQKTKYRKGKEYSIVCGNRRWHGALEARQKTIPCVIRKDLNDIGALGTSLQENLQRKSMDKIQESNAVEKMWNLLNGGRTHEEKLNAMNKTFGLKRHQIERYLSIAGLSEKLKSNLGAQEHVDTNTLAGISREEKWDDKSKAEAIEVLSEVESAKERRQLLSEMKKRAEDHSPSEALKEYKKEVRELIGITLNVYLNAKERAATEKAAKKEKLEMETLVKKIFVAWLKKENYLK